MAINVTNKHLGKKIKLKYVASAFSSSHKQSDVKADGLYSIFGASGLVGYLNSFDQDQAYIGIIKDGAGVGRSSVYQAKTSILSTMTYIIPREGKVNIDFLNYSLSAMDLGSSLDKATIPHIYFSSYGNKYVLDVSLDYQKKIVCFLNKKCSVIDSLIFNETKQIEKLEEYKKAVITKAVTKGLDPNAKMKDSGVEWIGEIPESWSAKKTKFIATSIFKGSGITKDEVIVGGDIQCVRYGEIYTRYNGSFINTYSKTDLCRIASPVYLKKGDILCSGTGELVEEIGKNVVYMGDEPCLAGGDIIVIRHSINPIYFNYALNSQVSQKQKSFGKAKLKVVHASSFDIGNVYIAIPSADEQQKIAFYLDKKCEKIKKIIKMKETKIKELQAYKKSLIYEYVTGKKAVEA